LRNWESIKSDEQPGTRSLMDGVPVLMGGLTRAAKLQKRAASVGFDWESPEGVIPKLAEEVTELSEVIDQPEDAEREIGDLFFTLVNLARHLGLDSEVALRAAVARFEARFRRMEELAGDLSGRSLEQLDELWERAKAEEGLRGRR
jgi:ATP diphosphatase